MLQQFTESSNTQVQMLKPFENQFNQASSSQTKQALSKISGTERHILRGSVLVTHPVTKSISTNGHKIILSLKLHCIHIEENRLLVLRLKKCEEVSL